MKISIITAVHNSASTIEACMESVLKQSHTNLEYIIIDGASTDGTLEVINQVTRLYPKSKITLVSEPDSGIYEALNKGTAISTGDIIGFLHSDDMLVSPNIVEDIVNTFRTNNCDGVYGNLWYVDKYNPDKIIRNWISCPFKTSLLKQGWMPAHPTLYLKKEVYQQFGNFNINYKIAADYEFILRIFKNKTFRFCYLPKVIVKMRVGGESNKSVPKVIKKMKEDYKAMTYHKTGNWLTLIRKTVSKLGQFV